MLYGYCHNQTTEEHHVGLLEIYIYIIHTPKNIMHKISNDGLSHLSNANKSLTILKIILFLVVFIASMLYTYL